MFVGVDGTRNGWVYCIINENGEVALRFFEEFTIPFVISQLLIDIPVGLPEKGERLSDVLGKKMLSKRASCIFSVPVRKAVYCNSYTEALKINREFQGKGFSKQFWNIRHKVIEIDSFLRENPSFYDIALESHPEICFTMFYGQPLPSKYSVEGIDIRLKLLDSYLPKISDEIFRVHEKLKIPVHDLVDASVLAISQFFELQSVPDIPQFDEYGIPMRIVYPKV